jgi:hypothetical protein
MYKYTVTNNDTVSHSVGIRIMIDTMLNGNDAAPFRMPGIGGVNTEMEFIGANIPQYWQAFYSLDNPDILSQGTLIGGGATTPDRFVIARWGAITSTDWDYTVTPGLPTGDSAVAIYWNPAVIDPGESREFITFYGLSTLSGTVDLSITGPIELSVINNEWSPNPFTVIAYITNNTSIPMSNVAVTLSLPSGLGLAPGETATHVIPSIAPGNTGQTSWSVVALSEGTWIYSVTAVNQTVSRPITVPPIQVDHRGNYNFCGQSIVESEICFVPAIATIGKVEVAVDPANFKVELVCCNLIVVCGFITKKVYKLADDTIPFKTKDIKVQVNVPAEIYNSDNFDLTDWM